MAPRPHAHRGAWRNAREAKNSRLGLATPARVLAPGQWRAKTANGIRKTASFTVKSWCADTSAQGGGQEAQLQAAYRKAVEAAGRQGTVPDNPLVAQTRQVWVVDGYVTQTYYKLSPEAVDLLGPVFKGYGFDPSNVEFNFGWTPKGVSAYTLGNDVVINPDSWGRASGLQRLELVAHEATHSVQYGQLGYVGFLRRYNAEYNTGSNYQVPGELKGISMGAVNSIDTRFTLDQLAERSALEVQWRYGQ